MKYIEVEKSESTHTEIKIGSHVNVYTNFVAKQYDGVKATRRYLKVDTQPIETILT